MKGISIKAFCTTLLTASLLVTMAQSEGLSPLSSEFRQVQSSGASLQKSEAAEIFFYKFDTLDIPIMDDFSIDRSRKLNAKPGDSNVSLDTTLFKLYVGSSAPAVLDVMLDTTWYYTITVQTNPDTIIIDTMPNPSTIVTIYDICGENTSLSVDTATWPPFDIRDTVDGGADTTFFDPPDLFQDSVKHYIVEADTNTYMMGLDPTPLILWKDDYAFINGTYPVDPPTVGVASLDGLDRTGYPYVFNDPSAWGEADHLTSVPIDLEYQPGDSIYLSFYFQNIGLSGDDLVQEQDSLFLDFYSVDDEQWDVIWRRQYGELAPFQQVMVPITDPKYLKNGFQFRFRNYATLSGNVDHWHLDYVRLAENRSFDDTLIVDVAYLYEESTLLEPYSAMPWSHFKPTPESFMKTSTLLDQKNLDINDRFIEFGLRSLYDGNVTDNFINGINSSGNAYSTFASGHIINSPPNDFVYDTAFSDTCAWFDVQYFTNTTPDINRYNDTIRFTQNFTTYYAYDDGSAEAGYWLNVSGAKLAYQFDLAKPDSMHAVRMYFNPIFENPSNGSFLLTIWSSLGPETILHQNFSFSSPEFLDWGPNAFIEYPLDSTIYVSGTIYVGWVQNTADKMNIGFDRNSNNGNKIFFNVANQWTPTSFEGSLMMRPVMVSDKPDPWLNTEEVVNERLEFNVYPNPSGGTMNLALPPASEPYRVELVDLQGRVLDQYSTTGGVLDIGEFSDGLYLLRLSDPESGAIGIERIVLQR